MCVLILTEALSQLGVDFHHVWFSELGAGGLTLEVQGPQWGLTPHHRHQGQQTSLSCKHMVHVLYIYIYLVIFVYSLYFNIFLKIC